MLASFRRPISLVPAGACYVQVAPHGYTLRLFTIRIPCNLFLTGGGLRTWQTTSTS